MHKEIPARLFIHRKILTRSLDSVEFSSQRSAIFFTEVSNAHLLAYQLQDKMTHTCWDKLLGQAIRSVRDKLAMAIAI